VFSVERTFFDIIVEHAARDHVRPAIIGSGLDPLSFQNLIGLIGSIWDTLRKGGVAYGSQVGIALPSGLESVISTVAIGSHATCVPLNPRLSESEFELEFKRVALDALIVPGWIDSPVRIAAEKGSYSIFEASKVSSSLSGFGLQCVRPAKVRPMLPQLVSSGSAVLLLRTSATTGPPKLVPVTHGNMLDLAGKMAGWFGLTAEDRAACVLPTYYAAGSKLNVLVPLILGESIAIPTGVRSERLTDWIHELRPTWFSAGPTFYQAVLDEFRLKSGLSPKGVLRFVTSGSAFLPSRTRAELEAVLGCPVLEVYGISEAGVMAANPAPPAKRKAGTTGLIPSGELEIRGPTGASLPPGEAGEIFVSGPGLMPGYVSEDGAAGAGLQDGWLRTGDIGFVDSDGFLTLVGRTKELINRGGEKVSPNDVEQALLRHPSVREAAAFGVPHPRLGENVAATVALQPGATITPLELKQFLRGHLAAFKIPQRIDIVPELLKSHTGKVLRAQLAEAAIRREHQIDPPEQLLEFQILDIWQRLLRRTDIGIHDDFFEAGGDSLLAAQMFLEVESAVGHRLSLSALAEALTIRQLADSAAMKASGDSELVTKVKDGAGTPFFFCHGDYETHGFYASKLAALLDSDQAVYLVQPPRDVDEASELIMEEMALLYLPRLLALQPHGKFHLGGYCNGGLLAWEIAHQLQRFGREVGSIVLVESLSLNSRPLFRGLNMLVHAIAALTWPPALRHALRREVVPAVWMWTRQAEGSTYQWIALALDSLKKSIGWANNTTNPAVPLNYRRNELYFQAMANYVPPKLNCDVLAIVCERNANTFDWSTLPWAALAPNVRHVVIPGEHKTCVTNHVEALARVLKFSASP
jgi:acyl-CoA synthetase (AMP-forming)/AMP-acid ligase II/thioesterase domain-containing protein